MRRCASLILILAVGSLGCDREHRELNDRRLSLQPAVSDSNAYLVSEGQTLFSWFNCVGCHAHGGGGMGPPLMDATWRYGSAPEQIYRTIVEGRPNGMPAFGPHLTEAQVWKLVAYVRTLGGLSPTTVRSARADHMMVYSRSPVLRR